MHSMNAVGLPLFFLFWKNNYVLPWRTTLGSHQLEYLFAFLWLGWIVGSRIYLAAHSPTDVHAGLILGAFTLVLFAFAGETAVDWLIESNSSFLVGLVSTSVIISLVLLHPFPFNKTLAETAGLLGTIYGFIIGCRIVPMLLSTQIQPSSCSIFQEFGGPVLRCLIGGISIVPVKELTKEFVHFITRKYFGKDYEMTGVVIGKFVSYVVVSLYLTVLIPVFWEVTGVLPFCDHSNTIQFL